MRRWPTSGKRLSWSSGHRWRYGVLEPSGEVVSFSTVDVVGIGALTFRLGDRGAITVKETTLTWTPAGGGSPQTAKLVPLSDQ